MDYCPWTWTSLNFMTQSHTNLSCLGFWRHLDKSAIVIIMLLFIIIITSNNRHQQMTPKLLKCETRFSNLRLSSLLEKKNPSPMAKASSSQGDAPLTMLAVPSLLLHQDCCAPARALSPWLKSFPSFQFFLNNCCTATFPFCLSDCCCLLFLQ